MYTRVPSGRMPRGMHVPENYSGNAFRPPQSMPRTPEPPKEPLSKEESSRPLPPLPEVPPPDATDNEPASTATNEAITPVGKSFPFGLRLPFQGLHIGFEELLLIGLILMISQEGKNDDLVWLLLLLLFIPQ